MNLKALKTPALLFGSGYFFFFLDHYHRSILQHGYSAALVLAGMAIVYVLAKGQKQNAPTPAQPTLLTGDPAQTQTINVAKQHHHIYN